MALWPLDSGIDTLRQAQQIERDRREAAQERATVHRLYPRLGLVDAAPVEPPALVCRALDLEQARWERAYVRWMDEHTDPDNPWAPIPPMPPDIAA